MSKQILIRVDEDIKNFFAEHKEVNLSALIRNYLHSYMEKHGGNNDNRP